MGKLLEGFKFYVPILTMFWKKKGGNYSRGDIVQGRILIKEIRNAIFNGRDMKDLVRSHQSSKVYSNLNA